MTITIETIMKYKHELKERYNNTDSLIVSTLILEFVLW